MGRIRSWFFTGLVVTAPVLLTIYITWSAIEIIDNQVANLLPHFAETAYSEIPGIGLLIGFALITVIGALAAGFMGRWLISIGESILNRMPVVRSIYGATKQILETVVSAQSDAFREVVLVEYPRKGLWVIGFVTGNTKGEVDTVIDHDMVNVFIPTTPNPTSGFLLFCPKKEVVFLEMEVEEAVKMVVSGGIVTPPDRSSAKKVANNTIAKQPNAKKTKSTKVAVKKASSTSAAKKKAKAKPVTKKKTATKKAAAKKR